VHKVSIGLLNKFQLMHCECLLLKAMPQWHRTCPLDLFALASSPHQRLASSDRIVSVQSNTAQDWAWSWACFHRYQRLWIKPVDKYSLMPPTFSFEMNGICWPHTHQRNLTIAAITRLGWAVRINGLIYCNANPTCITHEFINCHYCQPTQRLILNTMCIPALSHGQANCRSRFELAELWPSCTPYIQIASVP